MPKASVSEITELSDQAIEWIVLLNSDNASDQNRLQAAQWINRSPSHRKAFAEAEQLLLDMGEVITNNVRLIKAEPTISNKPLRNLIASLRALAAASIVIALLLPFTNLTDRLLSDYYTGVGEQQIVTLADGSKIMLNTDTAISVAYTPSGRQLTLKHGQAVFNVAADRNRPFEVATDIAVVKALGTVFEVREEGQSTQITVQEHAVSVKGLHDKDYVNTARVNAGQQAVFHSKHGLSGVIDVDTNQSAWQRGKLVFNNQPLSAVVAELDRYLPGHIAIVDKSLTALRVSGVFPINEPTATLTMIEQLLPIKITRITPWVTLLHG